MVISHGPGRRATRIPVTARQRARDSITNSMRTAVRNNIEQHSSAPGHEDEDGNYHRPEDEYDHDDNERGLHTWFAAPKYSEKKARRERNWDRTMDFAVRLAMDEDPGCECIVRPSQKITVISLTGVKSIEVDMCYCGRHAALLITKHGVFPATPKGPFRGYDLTLLRLMKNQTMAGPVSKQAWANGLQKTHEETSFTVLPSYYKTVGFWYTVSVSNKLIITISCLMHTSNTSGMIS